MHCVTLTYRAEKIEGPQGICSKGVAFREMSSKFFMMSGFSYHSSKGPLLVGSSNNGSKHIRSQEVTGFLEAARRT